jgi:hypothetical protein
MPAFTHNSAAGSLTINSVAMFGAAWKIRNLQVLWLPAPQRGSDIVLPGAAGVLGRKRVNTAAPYFLELIINGSVDRTGAAGATPWATLRTNIEYLRTNVVEPTGSTDGTRSAVLTVPGGSTLTEPIHVLGLEEVQTAPNGAWMLAELEISVPSGRFQ